MMNTFLRAIPKLALLAAIIVVLAIAYLSLTPSNELPSPRLNDKINHFIAYAVLAVCAVMGRFGAKVFAVLAAVITYGFVIEALQGIMGLGRSASWLDGLANVVGAIFGVLIALAIEKILYAATAIERPPR